MTGKYKLALCFDHRILMLKKITEKSPFHRNVIKPTGELEVQEMTLAMRGCSWLDGQHIVSSFSRKGNADNWPNINLLQSIDLYVVCKYVSPSGCGKRMGYKY